VRKHGRAATRRRPADADLVIARTVAPAWPTEPKGIASMLFALFILNSAVAHRALVFDVAAFTILASIVAHGLTDTLASRWIERRLRAGDEEAAG
jgi:NhaP-type Na+/H+ or K+/H+ antiporter